MSFDDVKTLFVETKETADNTAKKAADLERRLNALETKMGRPTVPARAADRDCEAKGQMLRFMRTGHGLEQKQLDGVTGSNGGFALPAVIDATVQDQLVDISPVRAVASVVQTDSPDFTKLIGRRGATSGWTGETGTRSGTGTPNLAAVRPSMGELYAYATVTRHVLDDAVFNIDQWLQENITTEFAVQEGLAFISGDGVSKPKGFLALPDAPTAEADAVRDFGKLQYTPTGTSGTVGADPFGALVSLIHSAKAGYAQALADDIGRAAEAAEAGGA